jgi:hypothetical protein
MDLSAALAQIRAQAVAELRTWGMSFGEIGKALGTTRERARQLATKGRRRRGSSAGRPLTGRTGSARGIERVREARAQLRPWASSRAVRELDEHLAAA